LQTLILIGIKGILLYDTNKAYISQKIRIISEQNLQNNSLNKFRYCGEIIFLQNNSFNFSLQFILFLDLK
jgi:hypothetical protein